MNNTNETRIAPLTVILTPATLTVAATTEVNTTTCANVRTLNFSAEMGNNWRDPTRLNGLPEQSLSLWNNTVPEVMDTRPFDAEFFDYWTEPSFPASEIATLSALLRRVVPRENASIETCGAGWNCSLTIEFEAPGYKCDQVAKGRNDNTQGLAEMNAPFNTNVLVPDGNFSYIAHTRLGEYSDQQTDSGASGIPTKPPPYPKNLGAFRTDPVLWIGHSDLVDEGISVPKSNKEPGWSSA